MQSGNHQELTAARLNVFYIMLDKIQSFGDGKYDMERKDVESIYLEQRGNAGEQIDDLSITKRNASTGTNVHLTISDKGLTVMQPKCCKVTAKALEATPRPVAPCLTRLSHLWIGRSRPHTVRERRPPLASVRVLWLRLLHTRPPTLRHLSRRRLRLLLHR